MAPGAPSARWRAFALVFGVLVPGLVWGALATAAASKEMPLNIREAWHFATVAIEVCALLAWSFLRRRTPVRELAFAIVFAGGALFAGYYCLLCLIGVGWTLSDIRAAELSWWTMLMMILSPFPCLVAYAGSASIALWNWHMLPRLPVRAV